MKVLKFKKIDAFATEKSSGNPAGYVYLNKKNEIDQSDMQNIAFQLKGFVSEVGFVLQLNNNTFEFRYFSSEREVEFCGHATIAIMYDLIVNDPSLLQLIDIQIITNKGKLSVENRVPTENSVYISAPLPIFFDCKISISDIANALIIKQLAINSTLPVKIIDAGLKTLIVPINCLSDILAINPNEKELKIFCISNKIDIIVVFCNEISNKSSFCRSRVFAPTFGYLEDPATGSGNAALGYYLLSEKIWNGQPINIEQNASNDNYNIVKLFAKDIDHNNKSVFFGGSGITKIDGHYYLI